MLVAKFAAIAMVGIVVAATRVGIERLASPHIFAGDSGAIPKAKLASGMESIPETIIAIVITIVITVVVAVAVAIITIVLRSGVSCRAGHNGERQCCHSELALHKVLLLSALAGSFAALNF